MTDLSTESILTPIALARLSAELLSIRERLTANDVAPLERVRLAARGLQIRKLLGDAQSVDLDQPGAAKTRQLAADLAEAKAEVAKFDRQINAGALSPESLAALDRYSAAYAAVQANAEAQAWEAGKTRIIGTANSKPHTISAKEALTPAGAIKSDAKNSKADSAIWYYQGNIQGLTFTASVTIGGVKSAGADQAAHMVERLRAAKEQGYRLVSYRTGSLGTVWVLATSDDRAFLTRAGFEELVNPVFARPDMPEAVPGFESMQAQQKALATAFLGWLDTLTYEHRHNQGVVARKINSTRIGTWVRMDTDSLGLFIQYVGPSREFGIRIHGADFESMVAVARKLAVMPEIEAPAEAGPVAQVPPQQTDAKTLELSGTEFGEFPDTPEGKKELRAAAKAFLESIRGQMVDCPVLGGKVEIRQRGIKETMAFSGNPKKLKLLHAVPQIIRQATAAERSENHKRDKKTTVEAYFYLKATVKLAGEPIAVRLVVEQDVSGQLYYDLLVEPPKEKAMLDSNECSPDHYSGHSLDTGTASMSQRSPDHNSGHWLDSSVEHGVGVVMLDDAGHLVLNLFLESDEVSAAPAPVRALPPEWDDRLLAAAESTDIVLPDDVRAKLAAHEGVFETPAMRGEPSEAEIAEQVEALKTAQMGRSTERTAIAKYEKLFLDGMAKAIDSWAIGWTLSAISARKSREAPPGVQPSTKYLERAQQYMTGAKSETGKARSDAAFLEALKRRNPGVYPASENLEQNPAEPVPEIVEYTTKKGKVLRGIIRTDLTLVQAKAIDPYTWKMNGGYFIREKHLGGDTAHIQAAPTPVVMTAEQQAEAVATAQRQAEERARALLANQVEKLRQVANKAIGDADDSLGAERKTNTAKRAREAGYALDKAAANKAVGETLNRVADAIEVGAAGPLAKLGSRAQLEELLSVMRMASYDADMKQQARSRDARYGRPFEENDFKFLKIPRAFAWNTAFGKAAKTLGTQSAKGNSRLIAALTKLANGPERNYMDASSMAITRKAYAELKKVKGEWDLAYAMESIARVDRLARMGVTDVVSLEAAVRALLPNLVDKAKEDPVAAAERAVIGQKVGIDFFPTPAHVAQRMARLAHIKEGMRVLEPSAGNGNLADAAKAAGGVVDVVEISDRLRDILTAKGYNVIAHDFDGFIPDEKYQAILMNPPYSSRRDVDHIIRAFDMLAGGGTLVALAGEGVFFGRDQKAQAFRDWLDAHGAEVEQLDGGTFQDNALLAQTSANARLIVLRK
ncbi:LPD3 domain-containing protein [Pseudomonas fulva]|uniref:LPD3 domain-containing protein n=1 Tax=Pseudomonas fulva TaxID=47880 RepID=UPI001F1B8797|nr:hypothetical protein [Pseudomonas fulva]